MQSRSPSWGAWIETSLIWQEIFIKNIVAPPRGERGLKRLWDKLLRLNNLVAPPRGERGLKLLLKWLKKIENKRRSPSWGAWIETAYSRFISKAVKVAPPRGERGLKLHTCGCCRPHIVSLPLVGSVD